MTFEEFLTNFITIAPYFLIKAFAIGLLLLHLGFSIVVLRQTQLMTRVVEAKITPVIYFISIIHFLASVAVLFWSVIFL